MGSSLQKMSKMDKNVLVLSIDATYMYFTLLILNDIHKVPRDQRRAYNKPEAMLSFYIKHSSIQISKI